MSILSVGIQSQFLHIFLYKEAYLNYRYSIFCPVKKIKLFLTDSTLSLWIMLCRYADTSTAALSTILYATWFFSCMDLFVSDKFPLAFQNFAAYLPKTKNNGINTASKSSLHANIHSFWLLSHWTLGKRSKIKSMFSERFTVHHKASHCQSPR